MDVSPPRHLKARKQPRQARSASTIDAIFEATIQVLIAEGTHRLTTTRVAERAGVSVGTMYQYFPHKQSLLYALNERYLDRLAERMEVTCLAHHGRMTGEMVEALITAYWEAKTERSDVTRALYSSAVELDNEALIDAFAKRMDAATKAMLLSAPNARYTNISLVNVTLLSVIFGTVRNVFERNLSPSDQNAIRDELKHMCLAYLDMAGGDIYTPIQAA
ncbi:MULTISPECIES: TetR/AcrR family transcriptional regulator [Agrobacterium]|uniref:TetR/AcrR family transcriptional regulator n=1 Tax=Agrobacterium TaxID=357 RepID=UPI001C2495A0|nr:MULTISPECIES: TetR/AcrR family transcriptional regulator [Agrobacterium]MDA5639335.1 TetR/AcrR family transcriptional regulator [Agrobacterium sp. ST15.13.013]MDA6999190.1 TetR/AcrR family transcriptional regulator [Agrobacterium salinitolerans]QXC52663.1 TetR/AcrR family transcriptional regulator [Agrobacterium salinitolerans]QXC52843.1 TetR/AcrR family transcriptional regulator [Agrobacterium salinitolerans]